MRLYIVLRYIGLILALNAIFMLLSACVSILNGMDSAFYPLLQSFVLTVILGLFPLIFGILTLFLPETGRKAAEKEAMKG